MTPYYQDDSCTVFHGDALDFLPLLRAQSVSLVVTDPPYFQPATHYVQPRGVAPIRSLGDTSVLEHAFRAWSDALDRVVSTDGTLYVFCDGQSYPVVYRSFYALGKVRPLVWDKMTSFNGYTWRHRHELIAWIERPEAERVATGDGDILAYRAVPVERREHPAEKPVPLVQSLIAKHKPIEGVVLDPFAGSGCTLAAARSLGCRVIGIEIEERYCEVAVKRLTEETAPLADIQGDLAL